MAADAERAERAGLWDTHCHLADAAFTADLPDVLARAGAAGITEALVVGTEPEGWPAVGALARTAPPEVRLHAALGLHPHMASLGDAALWAALEGALRDPAVVALGEIGLDYHYDHSPRDAQRRAFAEQLTLAGRLGLPIILHERESAPDLLAVLRDVGVPPAGGVWHSFSGDPDLAAEALALGLHLGFGGLVTFRRGTDAIRAAASTCPPDRLLLETDAPYLAPVPHRGRRNEPAFLPATLALVAELRRTDAAELAAATTGNARRLFGSRHP